MKIVRIIILIAAIVAFVALAADSQTPTLELRGDAVIVGKWIEVTTAGVHTSNNVTKKNETWYIFKDEGKEYRVCVTEKAVMLFEGDELLEVQMIPLVKEK